MPNQQEFGEWWVPGREDEKAPGILETDSEGWVRLNLAGTFGEPKIRPGPLGSYGLTEHDLPIILGITSIGDAVTLEEAKHVGRSFATSLEIGTTFRDSYEPRNVYRGAHLPEEDDRVFKSWWIEFADLHEWSGSSGIETSWTPEGYALSVAPPPAKIAPIPLGQLSLAHGWASTGDGKRSSGIDTSVKFMIDLDEGAPLERLLRNIGNPLRHLMTFATERSNEIESVTVLTYRYIERPGTQVQVGYAKAGTSSPGTGRAHEFLFDAPTLGDGFGEAIGSWFELYGRIGSVIDLFLGPRYRPETFVTNHFMNVVSAAEGYHRATSRNEQLPAEEHAARVAAVLSSTPEMHRLWVKQRLEFSNEPTLRSRIVDLYMRAAPVVPDVLGNRRQFVDPVVSMRNALAHQGSSSKAPTVDGREIHRLTEQMSLVLTACLLQDMGFEDEFVSKAIKRTRAFRLLADMSESAAP